MVSPEYVIIASVELNLLVTCSVVLEKDSIAVAWRLRFLILILIVIHISFISRLEINLRLDIARVLLWEFHRLRLSSGQPSRYHASLTGLCQLVELI